LKSDTNKYLTLDEVEEKYKKENLDLHEKVL
jgi:hypothetical protein